ncbi:adenine phosphoribosyltransferase [Motilibacter rhizosphaerae]|uniref:Adenine phosphoribosyltransferase n=1 Tax=Motilibacter rhizosphaerae TaxID=598652 RepID=A0A4Q7NQV7_9ACTN|nr:adenine phosphoribosyltransferase [Motilibacter rhizosphaerae]RZS89436.1 adenine phosphoribosyltransferase [Motilibacter rhizosphaerae]
MSDERAAYLASLVRDVPDFPKPGVLFKDVSPLLADPRGFRTVVDALAEAGEGVDLVAGIEARGFVLGAPVAYALGVGFVPLRKAGKLPGPTVSVSYQLEYATAEIEARAETVPQGARVLLVDDVLATGGTLVAGAQLLERCGAAVERAAVLLEIGPLGGRDRLGGFPLTALLTV